MYLTENRMSRNQIWCATDSNHTYVLCAKGILDLNVDQGVIDKILDFHKIAPNLT